MSSLDEIRQQLVDSELMTAQALDSEIARWREETGASDDAPGEKLVDWLVEKQQLTEFQGDALRAGHSGPFMLGPYRVFERVAVGRLGNTYRAVHAEHDQAVSLKVFPSSLKDDPEKVARMQREVHASVEVEHPNILRTFEMGQVGDIYYLALEDLKGETLQDRLDREGALGYPTACKLIRDAARGLAHLHAKGLVHRDVQPANMWITEAGVLKIMELGAVRDALGNIVGDEAEGITTSETVLGTFDYMAPEQAQDAHSADHRSDIYSLGCTLYHCLAGHKPFKEKNPIKLVMQHTTKMPPALADVVPDLPGQLSDAVNSMIAKSPDGRFQEAKDVAWALEQYLDASQLAEDEEADEVNPEYVQWLRSASEKAVEARSPELAGFLAWLAGGGSAEE